MLKAGNSASKLLVTGPHGRDSTDAVRLVATVAGILTVGAGVIHISAAGDHTSLPVMFAGFMIVAALQIAVGAMLVSRRPSRLLIIAALGLTLGSIGAWLLSRTSGLPFLEGGHQEPIGFKDGVTKLFELGSIPAFLLLLSPDLARVSLPSPRLGSQTLAVLGSACFVLLIPALVLGGGAHHSHAEAVALGLHGPDHGDGDVHQLSQAHEGPHKKHGGGDHASNRRAHDHSASATSPAQHEHTGTQFAGTPFHPGHEHAGGLPDGEAPTHHGGGHEKEHQGEQHHKRHPGNGQDEDHHSGGHGNGEHEGGHGGGGSDSDDPITISYEPSPSVCISAANVCVP